VVVPANNFFVTAPSHLDYPGLKDCKTVVVGWLKGF